MDTLKNFFKSRRVQKLRTSFRDSGKSDLAKKYKKVFVGFMILGIVSIIVSIALVVLLVRWLWNAGSTAVNTNPTVNSVLQSTKESAQSLLPTVPSGAQDFIQNGVVNEEKVKETFNSLPAATQQVWKNAVDVSIAQQLESATGASRQALEQLKSSVLAL